MKKSSALVIAALMIVVAVSHTPHAQVQKRDGEIKDLTADIKGKGRGVFVTSTDDVLVVSHQFRTNLYDENGTRIGRRADIYAYVYDGENWSKRYCLTEMTRDTGGHGAHGARSVAFRDKIYVTWEALEESIKPPGHGSDYDILMRAYDVKKKDWEPPLNSPASVISWDAGDKYADMECHGVAYGDKVYFVWVSMQTDDEGVGVGDRDIYYRTFDGEKWSDIRKAVDYNEKHIFAGISLKVFKNRIYMVFQSNESGDYVDLYYSIFDGKWSQPKPLNPRKNIEKRYNGYPKLVVYRDELYCVWMSSDIYLSGKGDYDVVFAKYIDEKDGWTNPQLLSRSGDEGNDGYPSATAYNDKLYVFWESDDDVTTEGRDMDIVMRYYNGEEWSPIIQVSPMGDNETITGAHNPGDDNSPCCAVFKDTLYVSWITYDENTGHPGGHPAVVIKDVEHVGKMTEQEQKTAGEKTENPLIAPLIVISCMVSAAIFFMSSRYVKK